MSNKCIDVVFAADGNYLGYAGVALSSAINCLADGWTIRAHIIAEVVDAENEKRFFELTRSGRCEINIIRVDPSAVQDVHVPDAAHWSAAANYRFLIGRLLPVCVKRAIYLDCDVFVLCSLHELYEADLHGATLGVVEDAGSTDHQTLGLTRSRAYFNSGVLLIDIVRWRESKAEESCFRCAVKNYGRFVNVDQDILNVVFDGDVAFLNPAWNVQVRMYTMPRLYMRALVAPAVVHFTTASKPWKVGDCHPEGARYREFSLSTPWPVQLAVPSLLARFRMWRRWFSRYGYFRWEKAVRGRSLRKRGA